MTAALLKAASAEATSAPRARVLYMVMLFLRGGTGRMTHVLWLHSQDSGDFTTPAKSTES